MSSCSQRFITNDKIYYFAKLTLHESWGFEVKKHFEGKIFFYSEFEFYMEFQMLVLFEIKDMKRSFLDTY